MIGRRDALKGIAVAAALAACGTEDEVPPPVDPVFGHGVASGDPLSNAVILWTRISSTATAPVTGRWQIAEDATFARVVASGTFETNADRDYTVKVDAIGLAPATTYYYRFLVRERASMTGRTRTAPIDARPVRFAVVSCASLPHGYFHAYRALARRPDIDAVLHLGDYLYEYADGAYGSVRRSEPRHALQTLADYRARYAQYRRDRDLQEVHRQHPFVCIWDDHEHIDNAYRDGTTGDNPALGDWPARRSAAARAYSEWIPIRDQPDGRIWRSLRYGELVDLVLLDTRIWGRDIQLGPDDPGLADPARQLLGADQEVWLAAALRTSRARWKLVAQQVMMTAVPSWFRDDGWDDYPAARSRFYDVLEETPVRDVVVLSGDVHSSWASELSRGPGAPPLAVELITPAVTSPGASRRSAPALLADAPWIKYVELVRRGFMLVDVTARRVHAAWFHVDDVEDEQGAATSFAAGYATYAGDPRLVSEPEEPAVLVTAPLAPA
ncbi:MAG: alkaline phosphatase D family protein [Labilithrix sp.]|nr:alkaline phosphatase D family protein [Labilithrix sp.]MCW5813285.1 alkaline phosphatase D family protein [Labilithrix sp.]